MLRTQSAKLEGKWVAGRAKKQRCFEAKIKLSHRTQYTFLSSFVAFLL